MSTDTTTEVRCPLCDSEEIATTEPNHRRWYCGTSQENGKEPMQTNGCYEEQVKKKNVEIREILTAMFDEQILDRHPTSDDSYEYKLRELIGWKHPRDREEEEQERERVAAEIVKKRDNIKCPGCDVWLPKRDTHAQVIHMERHHPEIVQRRQQEYFPGRSFDDRY